MAKNAVTDWDVIAANNTDVAGINIDEGMNPSGVNNAIRAIMAQIKAAGFITGVSASFADNTFRITGSVDATKLVAFEVDGLTANTTRPLTVQDKSGTIALVADVMATASYPTLVSLEGLSLVAGDILYATAADTLARLAKGTDGQILKLVSGLPAWVTAASGNAWTQIGGSTSLSGTTTAITSLSFTGYTQVQFRISGASPNGGTTNALNVALSSDNGSNYSNPGTISAAVADNTSSVDVVLDIDDPTLSILHIGRAASSYAATGAAASFSPAWPLAAAINAIRFAWTGGVSSDAGSVTVWAR